MRVSSPPLLLTLLLWLCGAGVMETEGKRVLLIPMPFTSHTKYHTQVARALSKLGHEAWVTIPDYLLVKGFLDTSGHGVLDYHTHTHVEERMMEGFRDNYFRGQGDDWLNFVAVMKAYTDSTLSNQTLFRQIQSLRPEFVIIDNIPNQRVMAVIPYRLAVPFAFLGCAYDPIPQRIPFSLAVNPVPIFSFTDRMTLGQRLVNSLVHLIAAVYDVSAYPDSVARYAPERPYMPLDMLVARADLWLVETDHIMDYPRATLPNVKLIGGTATGPAKPLSNAYRSFMDGAEEGVVIVSFGSYVLDLPAHVSDKVFKVLMELPFKAVFRSNLTSPDPDKILTAAWIPQNDLLGHRHTRVFVSHSGNSGQYEALFHAVPIVGTPMFGDQRYNAERARSKGFGETVDLRTVSAEELRDTVLHVAVTPSYRDAIRKASELFKIEFGVPLEKAAYWLDHVMKHGGDHLRSAGQDLPFYQFLGLDIVVCYTCVLFVLLALVFGVLYLCVRCTYCLFCRRKQKTE